MNHAEETRAEESPPGTIYTIGHSNHPIETFIGLLQQHRIQVLIDTRSSPFSRYAPQFNRDSLKTAVQEVSIKYGFFGRHLGGRPEDEDLYDENGHVLYSEVAKSFLFNEGIERLLGGIGKFRTAILCSEEDPNVCHRRLLVSRVLFSLGISVLHIRGDGQIESEGGLQEAEAYLAVERQRQIEEKHFVAEQKKRLAAEQKQQARKTRSAARRALSEDKAQRKLLREHKLELAKIEKERKRQEVVERQALKRQIQADKASQKALFPKKAAVPKKLAAPQLFDMEEL